MMIGGVKGNIMIGEEKRDQRGSINVEEQELSMFIVLFIVII